MAILPCLISDCRAAGRRHQAQPTEPGLPASSAGGGGRRRGSGAARLAQEANRGLGRVTPELALRQVERVEVADHGVQLSAERRGHEAWTQAGPAEAGAAGPKRRCGLWLLQGCLAVLRLGWSGSHLLGLVLEARQVHHGRRGGAGHRRRRSHGRGIRRGKSDDGDLRTEGAHSEKAAGL